MNKFYEKAILIAIKAQCILGCWSKKSVLAKAIASSIGLIPADTAVVSQAGGSKGVADALSIFENPCGFKPKGRVELPTYC